MDLSMFAKEDDVDNVCPYRFTVEGDFKKCYQGRCMFWVYINESKTRGICAIAVDCRVDIGG